MERASEFQPLAEISNRRGELVCNISITGQTQFIEATNGWIEAGYLPAGKPPV